MADQGEGAKPNSDIEAEHNLIQINQDWVRAAIQKDTSTLDRLMDDHCIFTDALTGDDKAQFIADIAKGDLQIYSLDRENVEVRVYGSTGVMTALDMADWLYHGRHIQGPYRTTHVYAERDGVWQIVAIHSSPIDFK